MIEIPRELVERSIVHSLCLGVYLVGDEDASESKTTQDAQAGFPGW